MIDIKGKCTSAKIFADEIEASALSQVHAFLDHPAFEGKKTRFMPDIHAGSGAVIGTTVELGDKVIPSTIGVDIGCGMLSLNIGKSSVDFALLDDFIRENIPSGFKRNEVSQAAHLPEQLALMLIEVGAKLELDVNEVLKSIGSLGGGNHFIEVGEADDGDFWLTIHTGSRNFGLQVANYHQKIAQEFCRQSVPKGMEYLEYTAAEEYFDDMKVAQLMAEQNREEIARRIVEHFRYDVKDKIESVHNYIDFSSRIIRKGAISAKKDEMVIIPWNMRDGLIIGRGKGNPDWNFSAPHGAGRVMSRSQAKKEVPLDLFKESMKDVYSTSVGEGTLDESPFAYKNHEEIEKYLGETITIMHRVKPLYNFKAS